MSKVNKEEAMEDIINLYEITEDSVADAVVDDTENQHQLTVVDVKIEEQKINEENIEVHLFLNIDQDPQIIQVLYKSTIAELKDEINKQFNVDFNEDRWVIGQLLPADDLTLEALQVSPVLRSISLFRLSNNLKPVINEADKGDVDKNEINAMIQNQFAEVDIHHDNLLVIVEGERKCFEVEEAAALPKMTQVKKSDFEYKELIELEDCEIIPNLNVFECPICFEFYEPFQGIILRDCLHVFCNDCIKNNVIVNDNFEIKCPFADGIYACHSTLQEREIKAILGQELYDKHLEKSLKHAALTMPESFNCRTTNCDYWCLCDYELKYFLCPKCQKTNCLNCQVIHEGRSCLEYQFDLIAENVDEAKRRTAEQVKNMIKKKEAMPCPKCGIILTKVDGCDSMKCVICQTYICWATRGPRWGPKGKGDISGGCKCGQPLKCHPKCNNCH